MVERLSPPAAYYHPVPDEEGEFVRHSDYAALEARSHRLQEALAFWMPGVTEAIEIELDGRAGDDAYLLTGFEGHVPSPSWGDKAIDRALAAEALAEKMRLAFGRIISLDHHNMGPESTATKLAREALSLTTSTALSAVRDEALEEAAMATCSGCAERLPINEQGYHQRQYSSVPCHATAIRSMKGGRDA